MRYQDVPAHVAQKTCRHRIRSRDGTECSACGSRKTYSGRWRYLTLPWFMWYREGGKRPPGPSDYSPASNHKAPRDQGFPG